MPVHIQMRRGSASEWTVSNTLLAEGEMGLELDTGYYKFGNGVNNWGDLLYSQVSAEVVEDIIGAMVDSNTETNIAVTYNDSTGKLNFSSTSDVTTSNQQTFSNKSIALGSNTVTGTIAEFNTALTNADFATIAGSEALTNKTITSPIVTGLTLNDSSIVFEGATANAYETTLTVTDPSADRTITIQDGSGTLAFLDDITATFETTDDLPEGENNLYYSDGRVNGIMAAGTGLDKNIVDDTIEFSIDNTVALLASPSFTGTVEAVHLTLSGDLTVNGTTTTINSTTVTVDDKNLELGSVASPSDVTANGGGIALKGATDKTLTWLSATDSWTSSEHLNLVSGKVLKIDGTSVLSGSALGSGVTGSSLTSVGTIGTGTWSATTIALNKGGTGATTQANAAIAVLPSQSSASGKYLTSNGTDVAWATVDALPSQTNYSGFYLTTNGSSASWASITTDPIPQVLMLGGM